MKRRTLIKGMAGAHWGPQCQPEAGDWYARKMYQEGSPQYKIHVLHQNDIKK